MYSEKVMDHFQHPRNVGEIENASGVGTVGNESSRMLNLRHLDVEQPLQQAVWQQSLSKERTFSRH